MVEETWKIGTRSISSTRRIRAFDGVVRHKWELERETYPRQVRIILISRSAPQPAMRNTPTGGTGWRTCQRRVFSATDEWGTGKHTQDRDNDEENGGDGVGGWRHRGRLCVVVG